MIYNYKDFLLNDKRSLTFCGTDPPSVVVGWCFPCYRLRAYWSLQARRSHARFMDRTRTSLHDSLYHQILPCPSNSANRSGQKHPMWYKQRCYLEFRQNLSRQSIEKINGSSNHQELHSHIWSNLDFQQDSPRNQSILLKSHSSRCLDRQVQHLGWELKGIPPKRLWNLGSRNRNYRCKSY